MNAEGQCGERRSSFEKRQTTNRLLGSSRSQPVSQAVKLGQERWQELTVVLAGFGLPICPLDEYILAELNCL